MTSLFYSLTDIWVLSYSPPDAAPGTLTGGTKAVPAGDFAVAATALDLPTTGVYGIRLRNATETVRLHLGAYLADIPAGSLHVDHPTAPVSLVLTATTDVPAAYLDPSVGTVTTPDPGPLPNACTFVFKVRQAYEMAGNPGIANQYAADPQRSWSLTRPPGVSRFDFHSTSTGMHANLVTKAAPTSFAATFGTDETVALSITLNNGSSQEILSVTRSLNNGVTWETPTTTNTGATVTPFDSNASLSVGNWSTAAPFPGRVYSVELRTGLDPTGVAPAGSKIQIPRTAGNVLTVPDAANLNPATDFEIVARLATNWDQAPGTEMSVLCNGFASIQMTSQVYWQRGQMFQWVGVGSGPVYNGDFQFITPAGVPNNVPVWVRYRLDCDNGAGGSDFYFDYSTANTTVEPTTWTTGAKVTKAYTITAMTTSTWPKYIGNHPNAGSAYGLNGRLMRFIFRNGIGATTTQIVLNGTAGNWLSVPDATNLDIPGDMEIVMRVGMPDWDSTTYPVLQGWMVKASDVGGGIGRTFFFRRHSSSRVIEFLWSSDGAVLNTEAFTYPAATFSPNQLVWWRCRVDANDGAGNRVITLSYNTTNTDVEPTTWTDVNARTTAGALTLFNSSAPVVLGADYTARTSVARIARAILRNGIGGTTVLDVSEANVTNLAATTFTATSGQTVTVTQTAGAPPILRGTVLDFSEDNAPNPEASTFTATTGQTVTVAQTAGQDVLQPVASEVLWKFDANDYPGTGTSYVDPRGRTWTLTNAAAITPRTVIEVTGSYSLDNNVTWTALEQVETMELAPTHAEVFFEQFALSESATASFSAFRVLAGTLGTPYPTMEEFFAPIGAGPTSQPPALTPSQEAVIHALVGAQFGDLEFDIGKSVRWTQWFTDDVFITDVNYGDQRYWIIDWTQSFPDVNYKTNTGPSYFDDPVAFRKRQFADAEQFARDNEQALVFDNDDWILWVDAHEGLSVDNTAPYPPDYDFDLFRSYVAREIRDAIEAGRDRVCLPFHVYLRHDNIQNVEYDWEPNQTEWATSACNRLASRTTSHTRVWCG